MENLRKQCLRAIQDQYASLTDNISEDTKWSDIDPDSLDMLYTVMEGEKVFNAEIPDEDVRKAFPIRGTVGDFITWVSKYGRCE